MRYIKSALFFVFFSLLSVSIYSQGIPDALRIAEPGLGVGARALGMGNAFSAISDDASASFYNPAGLGLIRKIELMGGIEYINNNNQTTFFGKNTEYSNSKTRLNQFALALPFPTLRGSFVLGMSYNGVKNLTSALSFDGYNTTNTSMIQQLEDTDFGFEDYSIPYWLFLTDDDGYVTGINGRLNQSGTVIHEGNINNWTLSAAMEIYPNLFIGGNLNIISGEYKYSRDYYEDDLLGLYKNVELVPGDARTKGFNTFYMNSIIKWEVTGWDLKLGLLYQLKNFARFGLNIQFPKSYSINEDFLVDAYSQFSSSLGAVNLPKDVKSNLSDKVEYDIITPFEITGAAAFRYKNLIATAEATLIDYSQIEFGGSKGISEKNIARMNKDIKDNLRTIVKLNTGVELTIPDVGLRVRGGFIYMPSAYKNDPSDFDKMYVTGGLGYLIDDAIALDLGYAYGWWKDIGDNYGTGVSRTFQSIKNHKFLMSFSYRF